MERGHFFCGHACVFLCVIEKSMCVSACVCVGRFDKHRGGIVHVCVCVYPLLHGLSVSSRMLTESGE